MYAPTSRVGQENTREPAVIRFHLARILHQKGWSPYRLARTTGLTVPTAYRLADPTLRFGRFTVDTLDRLCAALNVQPGDLLEFVPDEAARRRRVPQVRARARGGERNRANGTVTWPARGSRQRRHRSAAEPD
jgi:putative transcriptional regulator